MRIDSMTATFGKLDHETLTLKPGLNVIQAPNEWGKSTWCAFLVAMLYGISTGSRTRKDFLADKERYAPWSGKPMAGTVRLNWQGRDITIQRSQKGRIPFGEFRAYETESGITVPELTGENCGQLLLGVEQEVFARAGFLRGSQLPVGEDEALRRRLNALVTTGDESDAGDRLAQKLKALKNECRHHKTGRLPQTQAQLSQLQDRLDRLTQLQDQLSQLRRQEQTLSDRLQQLENHQAALDYENDLQTREHLDRAEQALEAAQAQCLALEEACQALPDRQTAQHTLEQLSRLQSSWEQLQASQPEPSQYQTPPQIPAPFGQKTPEQALAQAREDRDTYNKLCKPTSPALWLTALVALAAAVAMYFVYWPVSLACAALGAVLLAVQAMTRQSRKRTLQALADRYASAEPDSWVALAREYVRHSEAYRQDGPRYQARHREYLENRQRLQQTQQQLIGDTPLTQAMEHYQQALQQHTALEQAQRTCRQAREHARTLAGMCRPVAAPTKPDPLQLTREQTRCSLLQLQQEQTQLQQQLFQLLGQLEQLGDRAALEQALEKTRLRLEKLERYNGALTLALETLSQVTETLQRRFAPRINARARELFSRLTGGRYDRLVLTSDFSLEAAATDEDTPHGVLWRSDGTADQLYLSVRLAVAQELTPQAPLVLDDALVRFDDTRLARAVELLEEYGKEKQVLLFTCQTREGNCLGC